MKWLVYEWRWSHNDEKGRWFGWYLLYHTSVEASTRRELRKENPGNQIKIVKGEIPKEYWRGFKCVPWTVKDTLLRG